MTLIGLDIGSKRIGVALGETRTRLAVPVRVLERSSLEEVARRVNALVKEYEADRIIVGLPLLESGGEGPQAASVRRFIERLSAYVETPFEFADERYSTIEAMAAQQQVGLDQRAGRATVDAAAAAIMLQSYLDALRVADDQLPQTGSDHEIGG